MKYTEVQTEKLFRLLLNADVAIASVYPNGRIRFVSTTVGNEDIVKCSSIINEFDKEEAIILMH